LDFRNTPNRTSGVHANIDENDPKRASAITKELKIKFEQPKDRLAQKLRSLDRGQPTSTK
jgi:hypothetical protein